MRLLVTGAAGFLGVGIVKNLIELGFETIPTDLHNSGNHSFELKEANIFDLKDPYNYFDQPDVLIHCAWKDGFKHNSDEHLKNLYNHYKFIEKLVQSGIKKVVVLGTMHEVGFFEGEVNENTICNPLSLYGISKNTLRQSLEQLKSIHSFDFQWLRAFYIVDNSEKSKSIFSKIIIADKDGQDLFPFTSGENKYDFLDYDVFCKSVSLVSIQNIYSGIINISSGKPIKLKERVQKFIDENHLKIRLDFGKFPDREYDSKEIWGSNKELISIVEMFESEK